MIEKDYQEKYDVNESFPMLIANCEKHMRESLNKRFREAGYSITTEQWIILVHLGQQDGISQQELANRYNRSKVSALNLIKKLKKDEYVVRETDPNDARVKPGESQARNKYTYFASQAKKEGYVQIQAIFEETANHEKEHAKRLFKYLETGSEVEITASFPAGRIGTTVENLKEAAGGEHYEYETMYPDFAKVAREEGFNEIAAVFESIAVAEQYHEERYLALVENIEKDRVFKRESGTKWRCRNCGYSYEGEEAVSQCPACAHAQAHFEIKPENY